MNVVIDEAAEVFVKEAKPRRELGIFVLVSVATGILTRLQVVFC